MKKLVLTILSVGYLAACIGLTVHVHLCMGKPLTIGFTVFQDEPCGTCGKQTSGVERKGCCSDEQQQFKIDCDQKLADFVEFPSISKRTVALLPALQYYHPSEPVIPARYVLPANTSPSKQDQPIFLRVRNLRI